MRRSSAAFLLAALPGALQAEAPLSAIDWLKEPAPVTVAQPLIEPLDEPVEDGLAPLTPTDQTGVTVPGVAVTPLGEAQPDAVGLLPSATTGLPITLWQASSTDDVIDRIDRLPDAPLPALQALIYTLLLAEADPPADADANTQFLKARIKALQHYGAVDAALALVERAGPQTAHLFDDWLNLSLLRGTEQQVCEALAAQPTLSDSYGARVFCLVRTGDWPTAALIYDTALIVDELDPASIEQLALFLDPEYGSTGIDLPPPRDMTPLLFRLYEANGAPLPTRTLPRKFAAADLRGTTGWRSEIEAAERLARTGALPANRLLGLYTARRPAASGGIWDRVQALQVFDRAMLSGDEDRIAKALPLVWEDMLDAGLGVVFATLYGERLSRLTLPGLDQTVHGIGLLSPAAEAHTGKLNNRSARFLDSVALGVPDISLAQSPMEEAIARAFSEAAPARRHAGPLSEGKLGEVILNAITDLHRAIEARNTNLEAPLATLRFVGLEDVARGAALQILLLPPG
ncbi:MAG: hypothetical protein AAGL23_06825 [Pseudomonadota bacterium]